MTIIIAVVVFLTGLTLAGGFYLRRAAMYLEAAEGVWTQLIGNVETFIADPDVPDQVARDVVVFAAVAGCGCFTRALLWDVISRGITRNFARRPSSEGFVKQLNGQQLQLLRSILADVIRFDTLNAPVLGLLARSIMKAVERPAQKTVRSVAVTEVRGQMFTAHRVVERAKKHHRVPKVLMAA